MTYIVDGLDGREAPSEGTRTVDGLKTSPEGGKRSVAQCSPHGKERGRTSSSEGVNEADIVET